MNAWVSYTDANGKPRRYTTPARRIDQLVRRVSCLARKKPKNKEGYATFITIRIERPAQPEQKEGG